MDIRQLKYFLTIVEEEQITGAAKKLHISQPPLSQQLKLLEEELGIKLIERGSRRIKLTEAGELLRIKAEQILELTDSTIKELNDFNKGLVGTLKIGAVSSSGATLLPDRIQKFNEKYPGIKFEIWESNTYKVLELINSGVIEIGIVRTPFNIENYNSICLHKEPMVAAYAKDIFGDKAEKSIPLGELMNFPLIIYRRFEKLIFQCFHNIGLEPNILCKTDDARTTLLWAASGIGTAIVPRSAIELIPGANLSYKEIDEPSLITQIAAIWMKNGYLSSSAKHFLETFKHEVCSGHID